MGHHWGMTVPTFGEQAAVGYREPAAPSLRQVAGASAAVAAGGFGAALAANSSRMRRLESPEDELVRQQMNRDFKAAAKQTRQTLSSARSGAEAQVKQEVKGNPSSRLSYDSQARAAEVQRRAMATPEFAQSHAASTKAFNDMRSFTADKPVAAGPARAARLLRRGGKAGMLVGGAGLAAIGGLAAHNAYRNYQVSKGKQRVARYLANIVGESSRRASAEFAQAADGVADRAVLRLEAAGDQAARKVRRAGLIGGAGLAGGLGLGIGGGITAGSAGRNLVNSRFESRRSPVAKSDQPRYGAIAAVGAGTAAAGGAAYGIGRSGTASAKRQLQSNAASLQESLRRQRASTARDMAIHRGEMERQMATVRSLTESRKKAMASAEANRARAERLRSTYYKTSARARDKYMKVPNPTVVSPSGVVRDLGGGNKAQSRMSYTRTIQRAGRASSPEEELINRAHLRRGMATYRLDAIKDTEAAIAHQAGMLRARDAIKDTMNHRRQLRAGEPARIASIEAKHDAARLAGERSLRRFGHAGRAGKAGMVLGGAGLIGGIIGLERSRSHAPAKEQPRFASQAAVGRKQEIAHAAKVGAAYRAGLPAGTMSRVDIDSWYEKSPGERAGVSPPPSVRG